MTMHEGAWREEFLVRSYDADCTGKLRIASLFNYFQDVAGNHVTDYGIGYEVLKKLGYVWVLSRAKVIVRRLPAWGEAGILDTWHATNDGPLFVRDFMMCGAGGEVLLVAATGWLLVDTASFRPHLADALPVGLPPNTRGRALNEPLRKIAPGRDLVPAYERSVLLGDLDVNDHVNNARYLEWIFDCYDPERMRSQRVTGLQVNYVGETTMGDTIALSRGRDASGADYIECVSGRKGSRVLQAVIAWERVPA